MRNGIDVSGFSEIIEEVTNNPVEARFDYKVEACWTRTGGACATVKPARIGSLKAPRIFQFPIKPRPARGENGMLAPAAPEELALVALSGCFLVSTVSGLTAQKCTIEQISMDVDISLDDSSRSPACVSYCIRSRTDKSAQSTKDVVETVQSMSPNHRSFVESLPINICIGNYRAEFSGLHSEDRSGFESKPMSLVCSWKYGTQLTASFCVDSDARVFPIDQPKQLGGVDWAPNPQEYLLAALSSDILNCLFESSDLTRDIEDMTVTASANVDIRGMCNVDGVPVHIQNIQLTVSSESIDFTETPGIEALLSTVVARSKVCNLIRRTVDFSIDVN